MERALAQVAGGGRAEGKGYVCVTGVQGIMEAQMDSNLKRIINHARC